jgi:hypothetical protein
MPARRKPGRAHPRQTATAGLVRKTVTVDPAKLARARRLLRLDNDADVFRRALDYLLNTYVAPLREEE